MSDVAARTDDPSAMAARTAGWYGKIPSLGDFASRRLRRDFIEQWDAWLQHSIAASRRDLGERWLDVYLTSPMWRFTLAPGVCGESGWCGLVVPSVDKVGRYFPLTFALELDAAPGALSAPFGAQDWYAELEAIGLAALNVEFGPDDLETRLMATPFDTAPGNEKARAASDMLEWLQGTAAPQTFVLTPDTPLAAVMRGAAQALYAERAYGKSFWWAVSQDTGVTEAHCCGGLPPHEYFSTLLGASSVQRDVDPLRAIAPVAYDPLEDVPPTTLDPLQILASSAADPLQPLDNISVDPLKALGIEDAANGSEPAL